jgi:inorganic pyrophosphatase
LWTSGLVADETPKGVSGFDDIEVRSSASRPNSRPLGRPGEPVEIALSVLVGLGTRAAPRRFNNPDADENRRTDKRSMAHNLARLPHRLDEKAATCRAVVETPKGRRGKLDYDPKSGLFRLHSLLPDGMSFPLDFGFIPSTLADDGDPLDVMVLADEASFPGTLLDVRVIGVIEAEEDEHGETERNDRLIAAATVSHLYANLKTVVELDRAFTDNLIAFWTNKDRLEGKVFRCLGVKGPEAAVALIKKTAKAAA